MLAKRTPVISEAGDLRHGFSPEQTACKKACAAGFRNTYVRDVSENSWQAMSIPERTARRVDRAVIWCSNAT
jgi:hypothetical protein